MTYEQGFVDGTACYADLVNKLRVENERLHSEVDRLKSLLDGVKDLADWRNHKR